MLSKLSKFFPRFSPQLNQKLYYYPLNSFAENLRSRNATVTSDVDQQLLNTDQPNINTGGSPSITKDNIAISQKDALKDWQDWDQEETSSKLETGGDFGSGRMNRADPLRDLDWKSLNTAQPSINMGGSPGITKDNDNISQKDALKDWQDWGQEEASSKLETRGDFGSGRMNRADPLRDIDWKSLDQSAGPDMADRVNPVSKKMAETLTKVGKKSAGVQD